MSIVPGLRIMSNFRKCSAQFMTGTGEVSAFPAKSVSSRRLGNRAKRSSKWTVKNVSCQSLRCVIEGKVTLAMIECAEPEHAKDSRDGAKSDQSVRTDVAVLRYSPSLMSNSIRSGACSCRLLAS